MPSEPPEWAMKEANKIAILDDKGQFTLKSNENARQQIARALAAGRAQGWQDAIDAATLVVDRRYWPPHDELQECLKRAEKRIRALTDPGPVAAEPDKGCER